jgi:Baseplate J-like protein
MTTSSDTSLDTCGCCEAIIPAPVIYNRPGLPALSCRIGVHSSFLARMLARLPGQTVGEALGLERHPLRALTTRAEDDPAIALLDAWAMLADVLTFYQERIANEGYLRTATERRSILQLAREIGYELRPGVAASAFLAFTIDDTPGAPGVVNIPKGTRVQSVPGQGQLPQTFETSADITAWPDWNVLRPRLTQPQTLDIAAQSIYIAGTATNLKQGDLLLLAVKQSDGSIATNPAHIQQVQVDDKLGRTRVDLTSNPPPPPKLIVPPLVEGIISLGNIALNGKAVNTNIIGKAWSEPKLNAFFAIQGWQSEAVINYIAAPRPSATSGDTGVFAFRARAGFFGDTAPLHASLPKSDYLRGIKSGNDVKDPYEVDWDDPGSKVTIWTNSQASPLSDPDVYLARALPEVVKDSWAVFETRVNGGTVTASYVISAVTETSRADFAMSGRATGLTLGGPDGKPNPTKPADFRPRETTAYVQSESLPLAELPVEDDIEAGSTSLQLDTMVLGLQVGQLVALTGERVDLPGVVTTEIITLTDIVHSGGYTTLTFQNASKSGLQNSYVRKTVTLNANVAVATHGESTTQVLGSGDGSVPNQEFMLKKLPLTYVSASTASGTQSTLDVRVNGVLWEEMASLFGLGPRSEDYIVRIADDGTTSVVFGDGWKGARLPSGRENVVASYRSGIGSSGTLPAGKLTLLQTRPLGVRDVTNPTPTSGAADPESRDAARTNAPLTVLTLDRIVSLRDFQDFARAFAGIGKARALPLWSGGHRFVHITIASAAATSEDASSIATHVVDPAAPLYSNLINALQGAADPGLSFRVDSYQPLFFNLAAQVLIDSRYVTSDVLGAIQAALASVYSFGQRDFAEPVTAAEVTTVIQGVPGVIASDLNQLYRVDDANGPSQVKPQQVLAAEEARVENGSLVLTQLLLLNPAGVTLTEMKS